MTGERIQTTEYIYTMKGRQRPIDMQSGMNMKWTEGRGEIILEGTQAFPVVVETNGNYGWATLTVTRKVGGRDAARK